MGDFTYRFLKKFFKVLILTGLLLAIIAISLEVYFVNLRAKRANNYVSLCGYTYLLNYNADLQRAVNNNTSEGMQLRSNVINFSRSLRLADSEFNFLQELETLNSNFNITNFALAPQDFGVSYIDVEYIRNHFADHAIEMLGEYKTLGHFFTDGTYSYSTMGNYINSTTVHNNGMFEIDPYSIQIRIVPDPLTGRDYSIYKMNSDDLKKFLYGTTTDDGRDTADVTVTVSNSVVVYLVEFEYDIVIPYFLNSTQLLTGQYGIRRRVTKQERYFVTR